MLDAEPNKKCRLPTVTVMETHMPVGDDKSAMTRYRLYWWRGCNQSKFRRASACQQWPEKGFCIVDIANPTRQSPGRLETPLNEAPLNRNGSAEMTTSTRCQRETPLVDAKSCQIRAKYLIASLQIRRRRRCRCQWKSPDGRDCCLIGVVSSMVRITAIKRIYLLTSVVNWHQR